MALSLRKKSCPNSLGPSAKGVAFSHLNPVARSKPNVASISGLFFHLRGPIRLPARWDLTKPAGQSAKEPGAGDERGPGWDLAGPPGGQHEAPGSRLVFLSPTRVPTHSAGPPLPELVIHPLHSQ